MCRNVYDNVREMIVFSWRHIKTEHDWLQYFNLTGQPLVRQNILVSATLNAKVRSLAKLSLKKPVTVAVDAVDLSLVQKYVQALQMSVQRQPVVAVWVKK